MKNTLVDTYEGHLAYFGSKYPDGSDIADCYSGSGEARRPASEKSCFGETSTVLIWDDKVET